MYVTRLTLDDIRIISHCDFELNQGVTAFVGDNGQGKTTLLEALYWASHARSFRHVSKDDVIKRGSDFGRIRVDLDSGSRPQDVVINLNRTGRDSILVNGQKLRRQRDLLGTLRVSIFTPDDLEIIKGSSSLRREVIDDVLEQISSTYVASLSDYAKVLRQKNALLKEMNIDYQLLSVLNESLINYGTQVILGRFMVLKTMRKVTRDSYQRIAGSDREITMRYVSKIFGNDHGEQIDVDEDLDAKEISDLFAKKIDEYSMIEQRRAHSVVGPHRDDIELSIEGRSSRSQASQGEQRSLALAMRIAAHQAVEVNTDDNPVLLLDDVFSELDIGRAHRLIECLPATQTFVTTATELPSTFKVDQIFGVNNGEIALQ